MSLRVIAAALLLWMIGLSQAFSAQCEPPGGFDVWLNGFKREAAAAGISQSTITSAFVGVGHDQKIIESDRNQKVFQQSFEEFSRRMISLNRLQKGGLELLRHASMLSRVEQQFGVPPAVVVAIWGLETDFGVNIGKIPTLRALATLAYDCRRTDLFQGELLAALRIIDRGDIQPAAMRGAWAGELGQTQFLPSTYLNFGVDFDGDSKVDLLRSAPDALASTANFLKGKGWQPGQPWMPGEPNFAVLQAWNQSEIYARTVATFATRLDRGN